MVRGRRSQTRQGAIPEPALPEIKFTHFNWKRLGYAFYDETYDVSFRGIFATSLLADIVGSIYGDGRSATIAPFFGWWKGEIQS